MRRVENNRYNREYLMFMLREAVEMTEMNDLYNEVGRDEWIWLQNARDILEHEDDDFLDEPAFPHQGLCGEIPSGMQPMDCVLDPDPDRMMDDLEAYLDRYAPATVSATDPNDLDGYLDRYAPVYSPPPPSPPPPMWPSVSDPQLAKKAAPRNTHVGDTMVTNGGQADPNAQNTIISGSTSTGQWVWTIPIEVVVGNSTELFQSEKKRETIDDIIFGPVKA